MELLTKINDLKLFTVFAYSKQGFEYAFTECKVNDLARFRYIL